MARRVNTKFVVILGGCILAGAGLTVGGVVWKRYRSRVDLPQVIAQAEAAEKAGNLPQAVDLYRLAADVAASRRTGNADVLYLKLSDLCMTLSAKAKNPEEGVRFYQIASSALQAALVHSPRNREANEKLIQLQYEEAQANRSARAWTVVGESVDRFLAGETAPSAKWLVYRAEARLRWVQTISTSEVPESRFAEIDEDLKQAMKVEPDAAKPVALMAELLRMKSARATYRRSDVEAKQLKDAAFKVVADYMAKHPDEPEVVLTQAGMLRLDLKIAEAIEVAKKGLEAHPSNRDLSVTLMRLYLMSNPPTVVARPDLAEKVLKDAIAAQPNAPQGYLELAEFYRKGGQAAGAIAMYKECLSHIGAAGGIEAAKNEILQFVAWDAIAWLSMDLVEAAGTADKAGVETEAGKKAMEEAAAYTENMRRSSNAPRGMVFLLDGRTQFLKGLIPQSMETLRQAEANLSNAQGQEERLRQTKLLLARANLSATPVQAGLALDLLKQALDLQPTNLGVRLEHARVLNLLAHWADAQAEINIVLKDEALLPPALVQRAKQYLATAQAGLGNTGQATTLLESIDTVPAMVQLAGTKLNAADPAGALVLLTRAMAKEPENISAARLAAIAYYRLEKKDEAIKVVDAALAKAPQNVELQLVKGALLRSRGNSVEDQEQIIRSITDEYQKQIQLATLYRQARMTTKEIDALQAAERALGDAAGTEGRQKLNDVVDRVFNTAISAMGTADAEQKKKYSDLGLAYVQRAERMDLDGVGGKLYRGRFELAQRNTAKGIQLIEAAAQQRPDYAPAHAALGQAYYAMGVEAEAGEDGDKKRGAQRHFDAALEAFKTALRLTPNNAQLTAAAIEILLKKADPASNQAAQELLKQAMALAPTDPALVQYSELLSNLPRAIQDRENRLKSNPEDVNNVRRLVLLYGKSGDPKNVEKGVALITPLIAADPKNVNNVSLLANLYAANGKVEDGLKLFDPLLADGDVKGRYTTLMVKAAFARSVGKVPEAKAALAEAIKLQPAEEDYAERQLADLYFDVDDMASAEAAYQAVYAKAKEGTARTLVVRRLIEVQIRQKKFAEADRLLDEKIFSARPDDVQGLVLRAFARIQQKREVEAMADLERVLAKNRDYPDALYYRALARFSMRTDLEKAINDLLTIRSQDPTAYNARVLLAQVYRQATRFAEANAEYAEILKARPQLFSVRREYAGFLMNLAEVLPKLPTDATSDFALSIRRIKPAETLLDLLRESAGMYRDQAMWPLMMGDLLGLVGNPQEAQRIYEQIYKVLPEDPVIVSAYVNSLLQTKNYEEVVGITSRMIGKRPEIVDFYCRRANANVALKKTELAIADIDHVLALTAAAAKDSKEYGPFMNSMSQLMGFVPTELLAARLRIRLGADPEEAIAAVGLMHVLLTQGNVDEAMRVAAAVKVPAADGGLAALVLKQQALVRYKAKQYAEAAKNFQALVEMSPDDVDSLNNLAFILADSLGKPKEALPYITRAVNVLNASGNPLFINANTGNIYDTLGRVKSLNGDHSGAIDDLNRAVQAQPTAVTYLHLAQAFKGANRVQEAKGAASTGVRLATASKDEALPELEKLQRELAVQ